MEQQQPFPYIQLIVIVLVSVVVNSILFWIWHTVGFRTLVETHLKQNDEVRSEIKILESYVTNLATTTAKDTKKI